jgi:hypothetical protein
MSDAPPVKQEVVTLNALAAHQAVGSLVQMYTGILADNERQANIMQAIIQQLRGEVAKMNEQNKSLREQNDDLVKKLASAEAK